MTEWNKTYPLIEVAVSTRSYSADGGGDRVQEGDIVAARIVTEGPGYAGIGLKEAKTFLWVRLEGVEEDNIQYLIDAVSEEHPGRFEELEPSATKLDKRRYCIPLSRLQSYFPELDINKACDPNDPYQPFLTIDPEDDKYLTLAPREPLNVEGLIFDKVTRTYF